MQSTLNVIDKNWKALIKPNKLEINSNEDKSVAKVTVEPLEKGFGQTIGNSLRRALLTAVPGAAITNLKIEGAHHEFSTIDGVKEDVADIVMNLKGVRFHLFESKVEPIFFTPFDFSEALSNRQ